MKVALCLHGYFGTLSTNNFHSATGGYEHILETVLSKVKNVDTYVHCWQPQYKKDIETLYNPKDIIVEEQIDFNLICDENGISQDHIDQGFEIRPDTMYKNAIASRILSFLYSRAEALKLAFDQDYDCVLTTRFDIGQRGGSEVNQIRFNTKDATRDNLFTPHWNQMNAGYGDMWFYGSQGIMEKYSTIYKEALEDFKPNSEYEKILTSGWPHSNDYNVYDTEDVRQFSNEYEKPPPHRSKNLMKFPRWRMSDSHLYHKWFCMKTGLYPKTVWVK